MDKSVVQCDQKENRSKQALQIINKQEQYFTFIRTLLPNASPLVSRFFAEMSKKRQRCAVVNLEKNFSISAMFTDVYCNCKQQLFQNKW
jgi:hypothetical protein